MTGRDDGRAGPARERRPAPLDPSGVARAIVSIASSEGGAEPTIVGVNGEGLVDLMSDGRRSPGYADGNRATAVSALEKTAW